MNTQTQDTVTVWICSDCMNLLANAEYPPYATLSDPAPLSLITDEITCGMMAEDHYCGFEHGDRSAWENGECNCETVDFSHGDCQGCGGLAGERLAATIWFTA